MYESILKVATNDPVFKFKVRSTPYPPTLLVKLKDNITSTSTVIFVSAIAYSMIITSVVSYLVVERTNGLKHLQVISGMQLKAYWIGNFIFDFLKMQFTIAITIILFFGFNLGYNGAWLTYLLLPFGVLPLTYVTSFVFTVDSAAQTFTMFCHFFSLGILATIIFILRVSWNLQIQGDAFNWTLKVIPTYLIGTSVFCDSNC
jgi:ATP-binding cassette, subfamily A (ABC1), member 3